MPDEFPAQLAQHVPAAALAYCVQLREEHPFCFRLSRSRRSKWGDYRYHLAHGRARHTITVNDDLNPHAFLITYLHEVAHRITFERHGFRIPPHGRQWQRCFRQLLLPVLNASVFPADVQRALADHARAPRASAGADPVLTQTLRHYDPPSEAVCLSSVPVGAYFRFRSRRYVKQRVRRTRSLCQEVTTKKNYLILETTLVERFHYVKLTP